MLVYALGSIFFLFIKSANKDKPTTSQFGMALPCFHWQEPWGIQFHVNAMTIEVLADFPVFLLPGRFQLYRSRKGNAERNYLSKVSRQVLAETGIETVADTSHHLF